MYGTIALPKIMNEAKKLKILTLDIWPLVHGNQREQMEKMGHDNFKQLLPVLIGFGCYGEAQSSQRS